MAIIQKWGNSQGIRIPKWVIDTVKWDDMEQLDIFVVNSDSILIKKARTRKTIQELFKDYNDEYMPKEIDWGEPKGKEVW